MNICFIINPWEKLDPEDDSTLRLIHESVIRGHNTGILYPHNLTIRESQTMGFVRKIKKQDKYPSSMPAFHRKIEFREQLLPLSGFDVIFARNNPPIDPVMLNFLGSVKDDTFIINDIDGLRKANNKLYPASFHDNEIIPVTYVSKSKTVLKKAILESPKDRMILKPLAGYGGRGVIVLEKSALHNINSLLDFYISGTKEGNYVILQEFIEGAEEGDVRVLMLNGQPLGAYRRIPAGDDIRSNIKAGGSARKHSLTKQEKIICKRIGPKLVADGLYFVGLDIINGKLIEINVCSPGGITRINAFNRTRLQKKVIDFLEEVISARETAIERKKHFKRMIDEA
ncbi:MAG: glutathione synthase [Bacteroidales bacterium]|jgi:glutathione synthase|nr:glutathione synthase [Bacteroidales bacterium]